MEERFTKSPCHADDCLFMTSVHSFPSPRKYVSIFEIIISHRNREQDIFETLNIYDPQLNLEDVENKHKSAINYEHFVNNPYHFAVDDKLDTCWKSLYGM